MWTGRGGPPAQGTHQLLRSPDGYLWLSTYTGLLRFDGVRFTILDSTTPPARRGKGEGSFLPQLVDRHGVMWINGPGGAKVTYKGRALP